MKFRYSVVMAVLVVLIALTAAGCTSPTPKPTTTSGGASETPNGTNVSATPAGVGVSTSGGNTFGSLFDTKNVKWYEYRLNSSDVTAAGSMIMRTDLNVDYQGKKTNKYTMNMDMGSGSSMNITTYSDAATGTSLGGHMKMMTNGQVITDEDLPAGSAAPTSSPGISISGNEDPFLAYKGLSISNKGTESVTVPAGTYTATKYEWTDGNSTGTAWVDSSVPIPVKISFVANGQTTNMELTGWG
ncbi:MAG TPA: hypothetical protein VK436_14635 [Methanocella sp.]|nr:hypothetical protein [Methanocella sp.]